MRLIDADKLKADLEKLYLMAGWDDSEIHFSLRDIKSNIDGEKSVEYTILLTEKDRT